MPNITISIDEDVKKIISKRADKNLLTLKEQLENIVRQSAVRTKSQPSTPDSKIDDRLVEIFSRSARGKKSAKILKMKTKSPILKNIPEQDIVIVKQNKVVSKNSRENKKLAERAIKILEDFFKDKISFEIIFLETRKQLDKIYSYYLKKPYKTPEWIAGAVFNDNIVYLFNKDVYSKISSHKKESFFSTLVHEITHVYTNKLFKSNIPNWLYEGLAQYISKQEVTDGKFTRFLIETYGRDNLFILMKSLKNWKTRQDFSKIFQKVLGDNFDEVWKKWGEKESLG